MLALQNSSELLYIAGVGLFLNIILFATTLLVYLCKTHPHNTDIESPDHLTVGLLQDDQNRKQHEDDIDLGSRLIDLIPAMRFIRVPINRDSVRETGCSICLKEGFEDDEMCKVLPECGHVFHSECVDEWFKKKQSCPVCRKVFKVVIPGK